MGKVDEFTQGMAKLWLTVDDVYSWFERLKTKRIPSANWRQIVRDGEDAAHASTFAEFCDHVVLHRNVRIV